MGRRTKSLKGKAETKRSPARKPPKNEGARVRDLEKRLAEAHRREEEALEQQTATAAILRVISRSPSDIQPVFDAIVQSAVNLCAGMFGTVLRFDGDRLHLAAHHNLSPAGLQAYREHYPVVVSLRETVASGAILDRRIVQVIDSTDPAVAPRSVAMAQATGFRGVVAVPMLRDGEPIGVINVARQERGPFPDRQVALLQTFADQAVLAIENLRLFTELEEKNRALIEAHGQVSEALDRQTAMSEILRVISQSPTDAQPVFDAIVDSAMRLLRGASGALYRLSGDMVHLVAFTSTSEAGDAAFRQIFPRPLAEAAFQAETVRERAPCVVEDIETDPRANEQARRVFHARGYRSIVYMPMFKDGASVGNISVARREPGTLTEEELTLLQTFADQAVIAIENVRLFKELEARNRDLTEALEQQTATSEILRVISSSPTDVQPVFDTIVRSAVRLCDGLFGTLLQFDGELLHHVAQHHYTPEALEAALHMFPARPTRAFGAGRAILERAVVHIPDVEVEPKYQHHVLRHAIGWRSGLFVPMLREGASIGVIVVGRAKAGPFSDNQIELLKTFADQAVIAIENVRLFTELQQKNAALTQAHAQVSEALERQTATAEILRTIAQAQSDAQPVFDTIVRSAARLCKSVMASVLLTDGRMLYLPANYGSSPEALAAVRGRFPLPLNTETVSGIAIATRSVVTVSDVEDPSVAEFTRQAGRLLGYRSSVTVPMLHEGKVIGALNVCRQEPGRFSDGEIALLQTFADQAVIAIENVRLFKELEARNRDLTATSEILQVIAGSPTDTQPVFESIAERALNLCSAAFGAVFRFDDGWINIAALTGMRSDELEAARRYFPRRVIPGGVGLSHVALTGEVAHIPDVQADPAWRASSAGPAFSKAEGYRTCLIVPLNRAGLCLGAINVWRREASPFSEQHIELLKSFADQAVIAIENVRLFTELTRSVEQLTALGDVGRAVSSSLDLDTVLTTIVARAVQLSSTDGGTIFEYDEAVEEFAVRATLNADEGASAAVRAARLRRGEGAVGQMAVTREPFQIPDISAEGAYESRIRGAVLASGTRSVLAIPLLHEDRLVGGLVVTRRVPGNFDAEIVELLRTFATQSALAIQNARLFREIEQKSRELEAASRHKSEFLANMSHELRTPLNAIIGFSEVLNERMFGELNDKQSEYLKDIYASGQHLLSLINDILDLSKIEAGRMELEAADFDLPSAIDNALTLVRERATRRRIILGRTIDEQVGTVRGDERKVKQVLLNLLSNALKFTPEGGRIDVSAHLQDGAAEIAIADTGVGIAPEDQEAIFEEFRQVGTADKKVEGTGLGLALSRKFIELHGGRIWVKSELGKGSTFTFSIPVRRGD